MNKEWYKAHGYNMSINIDQAAIDRAEADVMSAYVLPILQTASTDDEDVARCVANLAFLLLMKRSLFVTRSGAKEKTASNSSTPDGWRMLDDSAMTAAMSVKALRQKEGAFVDAKVTDICAIYFTTNFLHS